jgi:hypothetical protein
MELSKMEDFLSFIVYDIQKHPENIKAVNKELFNKIQTLVSGIEIDLNQQLIDEDNSYSKLDEMAKTQTANEP